jgi:hypothetical protein
VNIHITVSVCVFVHGVCVCVCAHACVCVCVCACVCVAHIMFNCFSYSKLPNSLGWPVAIGFAPRQQPRSLGIADFIACCCFALGV